MSKSNVNVMNSWPCSTEYQQVIGPPRSTEYHQVIGPPRSTEYQQVIGPPRSTEYQQVIGPPCSTEYQQVIGPPRRTKYHQMISSEREESWSWIVKSKGRVVEVQGMLRSGERVIVGKGVLSGKIKDVKMGLPKALLTLRMRSLRSWTFWE